MAVKPTTQVYAIRDSITDSVDFTSGQSGSNLTTVAIPTSLDTLNREVLMIQEVDFDISGLGYWAAVMTRTNASVDPAVAYVQGSLSVFLTEVDPAVDPTVLDLASPHFIASRSIVSVGGVFTISDDNPDTASYSSVAFADHPLFTTASDTLYLTFTYTYSGNDPGTMTGANPAVRGSFRTFAQRGRADADTYAAILTGLYA